MLLYLNVSQPSFSPPPTKRTKLDHRFFLENLGFPLSIHPAASRYLQKHGKFRLSSANWQFRLSGISGAPFYSTPEFRLSSSFRAAPLFKVGNTLATFLLPPLPCLTREEAASDTSCAIPRRAVLQSGHVAAA